MSGRHLPAPAPTPGFRPRRRRTSRLRRGLIALGLVVAVVLTAVTVVNRVQSPDLRPIADVNPFRDTKLPESSSGSAAGRDAAVPTSATQSVAAPDPAKLREIVPPLAGTVPTTPAASRTVKPFVSQKPAAGAGTPVGGSPRAAGAAAGATGAAGTAGAAAAPEAVTTARFGDSATTAPARESGRELKPQAGRVEVPSLRTESREVFHNPDGTFTAETTMGSDRFKDAKGTWVGIDTALVSGDRGRLHARSARATTEVAPRADDAQLGKLQLDADTSFAFGIAQAQGAQATVDGSKATYAGVRDAADLELGPTADGLKEVLVLHSAQAPTTWTYPLTLTGLTAKVDGRRVLLSDSSGEVRAVIPPGSMEDSRRTSPQGFRASSDGVAYSLVTLPGGQQALQVDLDKDWLAAKDRVYPVRVDPNVSTLIAGADDTYVSSAHPSTNYASELVIKSGVVGSDVVRGYLSFPGQSSLTNATVTNAHVKMVNRLSASGCTPHPVSLRRVTIPWYGGNMTWPGATIGEEVAQKSFAHDDSLSACGASWEFIGDGDPRLTNLVNTWTHDANANFGLAVVTSDTDGQWYKEFFSDDCWCNPATPDSDYRPRLELAWTPYGVTYSYPSGNPTWTTQPTTTTPGQITVRLQNTGQALWPANSNYKLSYHIYDAANTTEVIHQGVQTDLPTSVSSGQTIDLPAAVSLAGLSPGTYTIRWDMEEAGTSWFSDQGIPEYATTLILSNPANQSPYISDVSPLSGSEVASVRPPLRLTAVDPDNGPSPLSYSFQLCTGTDANSGACWTSGSQASNTWLPPAGALNWDQIYYWRGQVSDGANQSLWTSPLALSPVVDQPPTQSDLGRDAYVPAVGGVHPLTQNYASTVTDASLDGTGPGQSVARTYNSMSTADGLFGTGWTSDYDMTAVPDSAGQGNVQIRYPDGRLARFGRNSDGSYQSPRGYYSFLQAPAPRVASFTGANSATSLGNTDSGENWQVLDGVWGLSDNAAYLATAGGWFRSVAVIPAPSDGTIRFTAPVLQDRIGIAFRVQDIDNMWLLYINPSSNSVVVAKRVGGWETTVLTASDACCATTDTYGISMSGGLLSILRNDRVVATTSDSQFSTATSAGLYAQGTGSGRIDSLLITADAHRDTFTNPDSTTGLGSTDDGEHWVNLAGTWGTSGNAAYLASGATGHNLATIGAAADGSISFTEPVAQQGTGLAFRVADANNYWRLVALPSANTWRLIKRVDGVDTTVADAAGLCCTATDTLTILTNGPSISVLRNGTQILSAKDPAVFYGSRAGPYADGTGAGRIDDLTATAATVLSEKNGAHYSFRSDGRLTGITDAAGRALQLGYDGNSRLTSVTNATTSRSLTFTWTGDGNHVASVSTASVAAHGGPLTWSYGYTGSGLTTVTAPHTSTPTTYSYAANGKLAQITLPRGNIETKIGYNADGTVAWREDGLGHRTTYGVLSTSPTTIVRITDPRGHDEDWEYSAQGQLISHRDATGDRRFTYNNRGFLSQVTDENGNVLMLQTDDRGNVRARTTVRLNLNGTLWPNTEYYDYFLGAPGDSRNDLVTAVRDARSAAPTDDTYKTTYTYDAAGDLTGTRTPATPDFPAGRTTSAAFTVGTETAVGGGTEPRGLLASSTDARGKTTTYAYDSKGDLRQGTDPAGLVRDYTYDELGRELTSKETSDTFPAGLTTTYTYDKLSHVLTATEPGVANPITGTTHTRVTTTSYDLNGSPTQTAVSDSTGGDSTRTTTYAYDGDDRQTSMTVGAGTPAAATTAVTFDANGNVATSTDPNGAVTSYAYTAHNLLTTRTLKDFVDDPVADTTARDVVLESRAYDPADRLATVTDALGRTTRHTYWLDDLPRQDILVGYRPPDLATGTLSSANARDIVLVDRSYDGAGNPNSLTTGGGRATVTGTYDAAGRLTRSTVDPAGLARTVDYTYDANDDVTSAVSGAAGTSATERTDFGYDNASRLTSQTLFGDGTTTFVTTYQRDQRGFVTGGADPRGYVAGGAPDAAYVSNATVNAAGAITQVKAPSVPVEENGGAPAAQRPAADLGYDTFGEITQRRDPRGQVTTTAYDALGRPTQATHPSYTPPGGSAITPVESWTYDHNGNPLTHVDTRGQTTTTVYDALNRPVAVTEPQATGAGAAGVSRIVYDDASNPTSLVDANGVWTFYAYDDHDRVWATTRTERTPAATFTTYTDHDDAGDVTRILTPANIPSGAMWTGSYDATGALVDEHDELGKLTHHAYDLAGRPATVTDPLGRSIRITYDRAGRPTTAAQFSPTNTQLRAASTGYDAAGNPTSATDFDGWTTTRTYDALDRVRTLVEPVTATTTTTTTLGYDAAGNATRLTDGRGNVTVTTYNSLGLPEKTIEPSTTAYPNLADRTWQTSYDAGGLPVGLVEPGGVTRTRTFDELGRLTAESGSGGGAAAAARTLHYDLVGQLTGIDHPRGSQSFGYDDRGLVTSASGDGGGSSFEYDQNGRMTRRADPGSYSDFHYNARGDLTSVGAAATGGTRTLSYDDARQLTSVAYGSGGAVRSFGYDGLGRTTADTLTGPGGTLRSQTYTYDNNDNPLTTVIGPAGVAGAGTQTYGYDRSDRLTAWTDPANVTTTYGWDAAGNRTAVNAATASFDERNRLLSDGSATYGYTARGTLSTRVAGATTTTTVFDAFDRLVSDTAGGATTTFAYDGLDRAAVRNGTSRLIYDGLDREPSVDGSAYARDPDGDIISAGTAAGNWATATDIHGSVVGAFTTDGAGLTDNRAYDPFGTPVVTGSANLRIGYQGSWTDPTSGKVDAQARWYTPGTGSFISRDSADLALTSAVSANRYVYAGANPLAYNDLTGRSFFSSIKNTTALAASAIVGGAAAAGAVVAASAVPAAELAGAAGLEATGAVLDSTVVGVGLGAAAGTLGVIVAGKAWDDLHSGSGSVPATQPAAAARPTTATQSATTAQANTATQANTAVRSGASAGARPAAGGGYAAPARATTSAPRAAAPAAAPKAAPVPLIHGTFYNGYSDAVLPPAVRSSDPAPISSGAVPLTAGGNTVDQTAGRQYIVQACQAPARCIGDARPTPTGAALPAAAAGAAAAAATEDPYGGLGAAPARRICAASAGTPLTDTCDPGAALTGEVAGYTGTPICGPGDDDCDLPGSQPASC
ncbi:RHS repeat-associated core domain, partial [Frankia torreyi]